MEDIVIATNNLGKINDFKAIFKNQHVIGISELIEDLSLIHISEPTRRS